MNMNMNDRIGEREVEEGRFTSRYATDEYLFKVIFPVLFTVVGTTLVVSRVIYHWDFLMSLF